MAYVLEPMKLERLENIFDERAKEIIEYFLKKAAFLQPEIKANQNEVSIQIPKEHLEQWCVQALGATPIGAGSYPIDIYVDGEYGADIKSLMCKVESSGALKNSESGEASLGQKFKETGEGLDILFKEKKYDEIKDGWIEIIKNKNASLKSDHNLKHIYYFFFLNAKTRYYLCGTELNIEELENVGIDSERTTSDSLYLTNYINEKYGSTKIYKAKKRLELRLKPKQLVEDGFCIELIVPENNIRVDLREELEKNNTLENYIKDTVEGFFLNKGE